MSNLFSNSFIIFKKSQKHFVMNLYYDIKFSIKIFSIITLLLLSLQIINAQHVPNINYPSSTVSSFATYGDVPVSMATGAANIGIPLYTIEDEGFSIPINLDYNSSGIRINEHEGWLGTGWSLSAGGHITRVVKGIEDELKQQVIYSSGAIRDEHSYGYFYNTDALNNANWSSQSSMEQLCNYEDITKFQILVDSEPDEFILNFNGFSAKFYMGHDGEWKVASNKNVKIELNIVEGETYDMFSNGTLLNTDIIDYKIAGFKVTMPTGFIYYFGDYFNTEGNELKACEYSQEFFSLCDIDDTMKKYNTWHLVKVVNPYNQKETTYSYRDDVKTVSFSRSMTRNFHQEEADINEWYWFGGNPSSLSDQWNPDYLSGSLIKPSYLERITTPNYEVLLNSEEPQEQLEYPLSEWIIERQERWGNASDCTHGGSPIWDEVKWLKLDGITIRYKQAYNRKRFNFEYIENSTKRLTLEKVTEEGKPPYILKYNDAIALPDYLPRDILTDHWGYYNGVNSGPQTFVNSPPTDAEFSNYFDKRKANNLCTVGMLERINYPTGGYTRFEFEPNQYSKIVTRNLSTGALSIVNRSEVGGGVRVKKIVHDAGEGAEKIEKIYFYENGILGGEYKYFWNTYDIPVVTGGANSFYQIKTFSSNSSGFTSYTNGRYVSYEKIKEYHGEGNGYVENIFSNNLTNPDDNFVSTLNIDVSPNMPLINKSFERGKLLEKKVYNDAGILQLKEIFNYESIHPREPVRAIYKNRVLSKDRALHAIEAASYVRYLDKYEPTSSTEINYTSNGNIVRQKMYAYNSYDLLQSETTSNNSNLTEIKTYKYPFEFGSQYQFLTNKNILSLPLETKQILNGVTINGTKSDFKLDNGNIVSHKFYDFRNEGFFLAGQATDWTNDGKVSRFYKAKADASFRLHPTILVWDGDLLMSKSYLDLSTSYTYHGYPNTGLLKTITDENGLVTSYEYDDYQRLNKIIAPADGGRTIKTDFVYKYKLDGFAENEVNTEVLFPDGGYTQSSSKFYDGLGRYKYTKNLGYSPTGTDVEAHRVTYDENGRQVTEQNLGAEETITTTYEDSPLNRVIKTSSPTIGDTDIVYGTNTFPLTIGSNIHTVNALNMTRTTDPLGHHTETYTDLLGRTVLVRKFDDANQPIDTKYEFNNQNQLYRVYRPDNLYYEYLYNNRSLLKQKTIPQNGTTKYYYDDKDRLVLTVDPNDNRIATNYDDYDRPVATGLYTGALPNIDTYVSNSLSIGTVYSQTVYIPNKTWIDYTETRVLGTGQMLKTDLSYDDIGRVVSTTTDNHLGGSSTVTNTFNDANSLKIENLAVSSIFGNYNHSINMSYDNYAQRLLTTRLNGTQILSHLTYDNHDRLFRKQIHGDQGNGNPNGTFYLQNLDFKYDNAGRMTELNDLDAISDDLIACGKPVLCDYDLKIDLSNNSNPVFEIHEIQMGHKAVDLTGFPYIINASDDDGLAAELGAWLTNEGIIHDGIHIGIKTKDNGTDKYLHIEILWEGERMFYYIKGREGTSGNLTQYDFERINCCNDSSVNSGDNDLFAMKLEYNGTNIDAVDWQIICEDKQRYDITYDALDRIKTANHTTYVRQESGGVNPVLGRYNMSIGSYTKVGDIESLNRTGWTGEYYNNGDLMYQNIDALVYNYAGGRLSSVTENTASNNKGQRGSTSFTYDNAGNMLTDSNKDITEIQYNFLNLPELIKVDGKGTIAFLYDAAGVKLRKIVKDENGTVLTTKDYIGGVEYTNGKLEAVYHSEGRLTPKADGSMQYEYSIKDHLGNTRVTFADRDGSGIIDKTEILQQNHYYPFGMNMEGEWSQRVNGKVTPYQYNGKELNTDFDINLNDYGARWYDSSIARWTSVDPLAEKYASYSGYNYVLNNPIAFTDPDGMAVDTSWTPIRKWEAKDVEGYQKFVTSEIKDMQKNGEKSDCADMACKLLIRYASKEGLEIEFTGTDGTKYNSSSDQADSPEEFEVLVNSRTNANSILNDMYDISDFEERESGDMTNDGTHVNVVRDRNSNEILEDGTVPTSSGTLPPRVPKNSRVGSYRDFKRWNTMKGLRQKVWNNQKRKKRKLEMEGNF